jgi:hypothetical protein
VILKDCVEADQNGILKEIPCPLTLQSTEDVGMFPSVLSSRFLII